MAYKYPYIADKKMYAAVMGACSYIRETGYFNKAVSYYADKYGVDAAELEAHIRQRQGAGQKGKTRKYKYYVIVALRDYYMGGDEGRFASWEWEEKEYAANTFVKVIRATSAKNAKDQISKNNPMPWDSGADEMIVKRIIEYEDKKEADKRAEDIKWQDIRADIMPNWKV